ncbi:hypothetical protein ACIBK9_49925 [Nonomuraea sp. NPDC050227]|uniref:hypothetical protein n=1 Tax=Nonomuraea sp. NPDC050227 TaxID=3364360 RepID=UPI0037909A59
MPVIKLVDTVNMLPLCYLNASSTLGQALSRPALDFVPLSVGVAGEVCCPFFLVGG